MRRTALSSPLLAALVGVFAALGTSCTDPVLDDEIDSLGPETGDVGPLHRPGQPCVVCHSEFGPASDAVFLLGGTVFDSPLRATPVEGVEVRIVDAAGARFSKLTNAAGNFYVTSGEGELRFPVRVRISKNGVERPMLSHIGREPSCANCHFDPPDAGPGRVHYKAFQAVGHIYLNPQ